MSKRQTHINTVQPPYLKKGNNQTNNTNNKNNNNNNNKHINNNNNNNSNNKYNNSSRSSNASSPMSSKINKISLSRKRSYNNVLIDDEESEPPQKQQKQDNNNESVKNEDNDKDVNKDLTKRKKRKKYKKKNVGMISSCLPNVYYNHKQYQTLCAENDENDNISENYVFRFVGYKSESVGNVSLYNLIYGTKLKNKFSGQSTKKLSSLTINEVFNFYIQNYGSKVLYELQTKLKTHKKVTENKKTLQLYIKRKQIIREAGIYARNMDKYICFSLETEGENKYELETNVKLLAKTCKEYYLEEIDNDETAKLWWPQWVTREQFKKFHDAQKEKESQNNDKKELKDKLKKCPKYIPSESNSLDPIDA